MEKTVVKIDLFGKLKEKIENCVHQKVFGTCANLFKFLNA